MQAVIDILPFALAAAVSPLLLTFSILVLSSPERGLQKAWMFVLGNVLAISVIGSLIILLNIGVKQKVSQPSMVDITFSLIAGILLIIFALKRVFGKPKPAKNKTSNKDGLWRYFMLGIILMFSNYSTIIMYFPAATILSNDFHSNIAKLYGLITMIIFSLIPSLIGPIITLVMGKHANVILIPLQKAVSKYGHIVIGILFGGIGMYLIIRAVLTLAK